MTVHELFLNWRNETNYGDSLKTEHKRCIILMKLENKKYHKIIMNMESKKNSYIWNKIRNYAKVQYHMNPKRITATHQIYSYQNLNTLVSLINTIASNLWNESRNERYRHETTSPNLRGRIPEFWSRSKKVYTANLKCMEVKLTRP